MTELISNPDKFYLLVNSSGYYIKTRSKEESNSNKLQEEIQNGNPKQLS